MGWGFCWGARWTNDLLTTVSDIQCRFLIFVKDQKTDVFVPIFIFSDRDECSPPMKRQTKEITSAEHTVEAGLDALSREDTEEGEIGT